MIESGTIGSVQRLERIGRGGRLVELWESTVWGGKKWGNGSDRAGKLEPDYALSSTFDFE